MGARLGHDGAVARTTPPPPKPRRSTGPKRREAERTARRGVPLWGWAALGAGVIAAVVIGASLLSARGGGGGGEVAGAEETAALLEGIPQSGPALGDPDAPLTLVEFADMQCPFCARWSDQSFARIVQDYVRPGRLRIVFSGMTFLGQDSLKALRAVEAAGRQDRLFHVFHLLMENQGRENSGWVTDELIRSTFESVPGLDVDRALADMDSAAVNDRLAETESAAAEAGINATPSFQLGETGGALDRLQLQSLEPDELSAIIDARLEG
jgi:protein-disulfide isomerase